MSPKMPNSRRNLDLAIERVFDDRETCIRLFNYRRKQTWPPVVSKGEDWESLYDAQRGNLDVETSVDGAIAWANDLIKKIDSMAS